MDERAFQALVDWQITEGSRGVVACGTTGESVTLSFEEHVRVVELCVEAAAGRVPVIAGAGSNSTSHAIELARAVKAAGADAALVSVDITMLAAGEVARVEAHVTRKTRTLAFLGAECWSADGERVATAASVHKVAAV